MGRDTDSTRKSYLPELPESAKAAYAKPPEVIELLAKVETLLGEGQIKKAATVITNAKVKSPWLTNATGVCLMRLGDAQRAVDQFRGLVITGVCFRTDAPTIFMTNFATALLLANNLSGSLEALAAVNDEKHPAVQRIRGAVQRWKEGLTFWAKLRWYLGGEGHGTVPLDFAPGDL